MRQCAGAQPFGEGTQRKPIAMRFHADFEEFHEPYATDAGLLRITREYLVAIGHRR